MASAVDTQQTPAAPGSAANDAGEAAPKSRRSLKPLVALLPYLTKHKWHLAGGFIALVLSAAVMLAFPTAVGGMIDQGFHSAAGHVIDGWFRLLLLLGLVLAISSSTRVYIVNWLGERVVADLRADVFRHVASLGPAFFERTHSGEVMSRLTADTTQLKSVAGSTLSQALRNLIMLLGALTMMVVTSPKLAGLVLLAIPAAVLPIVIYGRVVTKLSRRAQDKLAEASAYAAENLAAARTMQAFAHEGRVAARFANAVEQAFDAAGARLRARAFLTAMVIFLVITCVTGVLWYGASSVVRGEITGGTLSKFLLYALFAAGALAELAEVWGEVAQGAGAAERLTELLAVPPEIVSPANPVALPVPPKGEIEFRSVRFAYPTRPDTSALQSISFKVAPGETVALVGPSGSGKSTIFNLALRFFDPVSGTVLLDGVDLKQADIAEVRKRIALVPQEVALFADTVAENISYGSTDASFQEIRDAAAAAQASEFIDKLPQGYHTKLGERGVQLSGGQRQRLAIARAILKKAPILLLDEATSALDTENEMLVQRALEGLMKTRTTIVIAHRLATVQKADRILVVENGRIVEEGRHADLLRREGVYARLAALQLVKQAAE